MDEHVEMQRFVEKDILDPTNTFIFDFGECLRVQKRLFFLSAKPRGWDADAGTGAASAALTLCW